MGEKEHEAGWARRWEHLERVVEGKEYGQNILTIKIL